MSIAAQASDAEPPFGESAKPNPWSRLLTVAKIAVAAGLLVLLYHQARQHESLDQLVSHPKDWPLLFASLVVVVMALAVSFVRWHVVIRSAGLVFPLAQAFRLGAMGHALSFVGPGAVGGDLFKAVAVARGHKGDVTAALTTIAVDRVFGLVSKLAFAAAAFLVALNAGAEMAAEVRVAGWLFVAWALGVLALGGALLAPGLAGPAVRHTLSRLPLVGGLLARLVAAWLIYRRNKALLGLAFALSLVVDLLLVLSFYFVAVGLPLQAPSLAWHLFIVPMGLVAGAVPLTPAGLGTRELVIDTLYSGMGYGEGQGALIAFAHFLVMLAAGGVATLYYLASSRKKG
ncbi:MAG: lysylphosphatidylglycerol synthase transmembrane domain-containing protein [Planctomycetota bacterium]